MMQHVSLQTYLGQQIAFDIWHRAERKRKYANKLDKSDVLLYVI